MIKKESERFKGTERCVWGGGDEELEKKIKWTYELNMRLYTDK